MELIYVLNSFEQKKPTQRWWYIKGQLLHYLKILLMQVDIPRPLKRETLACCHFSKH